VRTVVLAISSVPQRLLTAPKTTVPPPCAMILAEPLAVSGAPVMARSAPGSGMRVSPAGAATPPASVRLLPFRARSGETAEEVSGPFNMLVPAVARKAPSGALPLSVSGSGTVTPPLSSSHEEPSTSVPPTALPKA